MSDLYAVVEFNVFGENDEASVWSRLADAIFDADELNACARREKRTEEYRVFRLVEVPESGQWEWAVKHNAIGGSVAEYVNERAARACCRDGDELLRRRPGASAWTPAPAETTEAADAQEGAGCV